MKLERLTLSRGTAGIDQTIAKMADLACGIYGSGSPAVRAQALAIVRDAGVRERDYVGETIAVHQWVMDHVRYVHDPIGYELISTPELMLADIVKNGGKADEDCDGHCILEAALLGALGIDSRFVVIGTDPNAGFTHVYLEAFDAKKGYWFPLDPIVKNKPPGWSAPDAVKKKTYPRNRVGLKASDPLGDLLGFIFVGGPVVRLIKRWLP